MKLTVSTRPCKTKSEIKQIRRKGNIPAVIYSPGKTGEAIELNGAEFGAVLREIKSGQLPTTIFTLMRDNKEIRAIIKDIQYNMINYKVTHVDFEELSEKVPVTVNVPVTCVGMLDCVGIKLGGFLRQVARSVKVECFPPEQMPREFVVDVRDMGVFQKKRLSDLPMPKGVKPLDKLDNVLVVIAKQRSA